MQVKDEFGITKEEKETIQREGNRLKSLGYNVPETCVVKFIPTANGLAGTMKQFYIHPNTNLEELRFTVAHEIGHHNEPEQEFDIWDDDSLDFEKRRQKSEDFANRFAENI